VPELTPEQIKVFLLAGNRLFREALTRILTSKNDLGVVGCAACVPEALEEIEKTDPDVVLVDPVNGEPCDISFLRRVSDAAPRSKTVLIDMVEDESTFLRAVRAGVAGYVLQHASAVDVVATIRAVHQGEAVCPPRLCMSLFRYVAKNANDLEGFRSKSNAGLTRREQELVPLIAKGLTNKEIASRLNLSEQTVKNHIHRILQRMGASDRLAVVEKVRDQSLSVEM
jgi:DNA-binding NarL/FixJ family response regulator